jgi:hypothetical protein
MNVIVEKITTAINKEGEKRPEIVFICNNRLTALAAANKVIDSAL